MHEEETKAELVCLSGCKRAYYCRDCWEYVHKRPKLRNHKYKRVSRAQVLDLMRNERIATLPKSHLPWKTLAPSLFQLFRVVVENADVEKVIVVEEELAGLCNTFTPNSCTLDCSKIDLDYLKALTLTPIGLVGDSIAIYGFLRSHLQFKDADYTNMIDPDVCPPGLYALMPNKAALFVFYWRSSRKTADKEINRIACQMLKQVRDLCNEIVVCVENETFLNSNFAQSPGRRNSSNDILENFYTVFRKYPITNCYVKETKPLKITFVFPQQPNLHVSSGHFKFYFHSMLRALSSETGKHVDQLKKGMTVQTCSAEDFSNMFFSLCEPVRVGDFVLAVLTAVPIQIARVENNRLIPLTKEVNVSLAGSLTSTDNVNTILSFGVYEAVLRYAKAPAKVVSATGKQSVCKSFLINHMMGSLFDIADDRCTHGVWMAIKLYPDVTVIALDFEGFGSFERSSQEDVFMAIFGAAVSSLTVFKMALSLDEDTRHMFDCSKNGANHPTTDKTGKRLLNETFAVVCKDISSKDVPNSLNGILHQLKVEVLTTSLDNSFVVELHGENYRCLTSETFGKENSFASLDMLKEYLHDQDRDVFAEVYKVQDTPEGNDRQQKRIPSARGTAHIMRTVPARILLPDWTALVGTDSRLQRQQYDTETIYCDKSCNLPKCTNYCSRSFDHKGDHQCNIDYCPKVCILCKNRCASSDHLHSLKTSTHLCDREHDCQAMFPKCESICLKPYHDEGLHSIEHSKIVNQVFAISKSGKVIGDTHTGAETCDQFCKRLGRGHTHFMPCPGNHSSNFSNANVKHDVGKGSKGEVLDEVTHEYYWDYYKIQDNCSKEERELFRKCNRVCEAVESNHNFTTENDAFCQLELWHAKIASVPSGVEGHTSNNGHFFWCKHAVIGYHFVLLVDRSMSMGRTDYKPERSCETASSLKNRLGAVLETCDNFCERRRQKGTDFLTLITFNATAKVHFEGQAMSACIWDVCKSNGLVPEGDTSFAPALEEAKNTIGRFVKRKVKNKRLVPVVIMLSDGFCHDADLAISKATELKSFRESFRGPEVFCILFGKGLMYSIQAAGRAIIGRGSGRTIFESISTDKKVHTADNTIQLNDVLREFDSKMMQGKIGVTRRE